MTLAWLAIAISLVVIVVDALIVIREMRWENAHREAAGLKRRWRAVGSSR